MVKLTNEQIRELIKREKQGVNPYKDEVDLTIDQAVSLYESKVIDEVTLRALTSIILSTTVTNTISSFKVDLMRGHFSNSQSVEPNKLFLLNYSKESYAQ